MRRGSHRDRRPALPLRHRLEQRLGLGRQPPPQRAHHVRVDRAHAALELGHLADDVLPAAERGDVLCGAGGGGEDGRGARACP